MVLYARVIGKKKTRTCIGSSINLKWDLRRESNATLGKTHALLLHKRQQLARRLEVWRAATKEPAMELAL